LAVADWLHPAVAAHQARLWVGAALADEMLVGDAPAAGANPVVGEAAASWAAGGNSANSSNASGDRTTADPCSDRPSKHP